MTKEFENYIRLDGPCGVWIELDASRIRINSIDDNGEINWDDNSAGVHYKGCESSFDYAWHTEEVDYEELSKTAYDWLDKKFNMVRDFEEYHRKRIADEERIKKEAIALRENKMTTEKKQKRPNFQSNEVLNIEIGCVKGIRVSLSHEEPEGGFDGTSEPSFITISDKHNENRISIDVDVWKLMQRAIKENWEI